MQRIQNRYPTLDKYILVKTLGSGYYSKVKLGYDPVNTKYFAVKIIKHSHPKLCLRTIKKEIEILSALKHTNIVNLLEFHESINYNKKNGESYKVVAIFMELIPNGELFEYVFVSERFSEETARIYFRILIETLEYCHSQGIAHRDLKPENLLLDANFNLKVADFGFATLWAGEDNSGQLHTILGTKAYMAPELHMKKAYNGPSVDLFASGIILFIMYSGLPPFGTAHPETDPHYKAFITNKERFWNFHKRNKPENFYSEEFKDLINAMLALDPKDRPNIEQIKGHPWFNGPVPDIDKLKAEFTETKKKVFDKLSKEREDRKREKLMVRMQALQSQQVSTQPNQALYTGIKPFRSLELEVEQYLSKELEAKVNFENKRELEEYRVEAGFRAFTEVFTVMSPDFIFKLLCSLCQGNLSDFTVAKNRYKIKGKANRDEGSCTLNVVLSKVDETTTCIEFHKKSGAVMTFYRVVDDIKKKLPVMESTDDKIEAKTETQAQ